MNFWESLVFQNLGISGSRAGFRNKLFYLTLTSEYPVLTVILNICPPNCNKYESNSLVKHKTNQSGPKHPCRGKGILILCHNSLMIMTDIFVSKRHLTITEITFPMEWKNNNRNILREMLNLSRSLIEVSERYNKVQASHHLAGNGSGGSYQKARTAEKQSQQNIQWLRKITDPFFSCLLRSDPKYQTSRSKESEIFWIKCNSDSFPSCVVLK